jgi:hypothetical protein
MDVTPCVLVWGFGGILCRHLQSRRSSRDWGNSIDTGVMRSRVEAVEFEGGKHCNYINTAKFWCLFEQNISTHVCRNMLL